MKIAPRNRICLKAWKHLLMLLFLAGMLICTFNCKGKFRVDADSYNEGLTNRLDTLVAPPPEPPIARIPVQREVQIRHFFQYIAGIVQQYDTISRYKLTENLLLRANPWLMDTLANTDYYIQMKRGHFVYEQPKMVVLQPGDTLLIPGPMKAAALLEKMAKTWIEVNIPAFTLRIWEGDSVLFSMPVRVGKDKEKYLEAASHRVDLRTRTGEGEIIRVNRFPIFIDPVTGEKFKFTKRDDRRKTLMPQIPWLEPSINGQRYGQMIHPTTNPRSLGKMTSNGCIGLSEANAWRLYCFAPIGTKVSIRYELMEVNESGDTLRYKDIYHLQKTGKTGKPRTVSGFIPDTTAGICICDSLF